VARWLARAHPDEIEIDWDRHVRQARLGSALPRFLPLLEEDALVEAHPPYAEWIEAARGGLGWLVRQLERSGLGYEQQAEVYDSLELPLCWRLGAGPATRSQTRIPVRAIYYHDGPLLKRSDISLDAEVTAPPLPLERVPKSEGQALLALARDTSAVRYRELYGFTHGDPASVWRAPSERGVDIFLFGVPPERRLPLRAYHAGMMFKNGVPLGYVECLSLFERMEVGFNLYYTFREGETAWLYARLLRLFRQYAGVTCFSIDPYQIGHENEEAIESGAFWFYRKLGFRPGRPELAALVEAEERKIAANPRYRTPARTLRKLAAGHVFFEMPRTPRGDWDRFRARTLGMTVLREMAKSGGDADAFRAACTQRLASALNLSPGELTSDERYAFSNVALALNSAADLRTWTAAEKSKLLHIVRAKMADEEWDYLRLIREHPRLRQALIRLGSPRAVTVDV